jgi:hypothetical protein
MIRIRTKIDEEHRVLTLQSSERRWITLISKVYPETRAGFMEAASLKEAGQNHLQACNLLQKKLLIKDIDPRDFEM